MGLISWPLDLAGHALGAVNKGLGLARANTLAIAGDLVGMRGDDPLDARDPDFIRATMPANRQIANVLFRPKVRGLEHIPAEGPVLLVGNHSGGTMIIDTFVFSFAFYRYFGPERRFHQLAHDLAVKFPGLSALIRGYGTVPASHKYAERALEAGAAVLVYPGGDFESFRPSWHSEEIEFGGRKGFVSLALSQDVPIVPVVSIGGQESALFVIRGERIAKLLMLDRLLRIKVLPVILGPPFGLSIMDLPPRLPLPSQVTIKVLPAIDLRDRFGSEPDEDEVYEHVTAVMQEALDELADERDLPLVGTVWSDRSGDDDEDPVEADDDGSEASSIGGTAPWSWATGEDEEGEARSAHADHSAAGRSHDDGAQTKTADPDVPHGAANGGQAGPEVRTVLDARPTEETPSVAEETTVAEVAAEADAVYAGEADPATEVVEAIDLPEAADGVEAGEADLAPDMAGTAAISEAAEEVDAPARPEVPATPEAAVAETATGAEPTLTPTSDLVPAAAHLDEEPSSLVAEVADPGAEGGAGAELHVEEPWAGYARMRVREISEHMGAVSDEAVLAVRLYEAVHKNRRGVIEAVERELKRR